MSRDGSFWRNVAIIGFLHVAVISTVVRWSSAPPKAPASNILWMDGGAGIQQAALAIVPPANLPDAQIIEDAPIETPPSDPPQPEEERAPPESDIKVPTATPKPKPVATPKPTPRATPKPTPKKTVVAKAASTPTRPKPTATPTAKDEPSPVATAAPDVAEAIAAATKTGSAPTAGISGAGAGGSGGRGVGPGGASQFGWYAHMLHDRFFSQWEQPTSVVRSGAKMSTLVKLRIEKDGTVSRFSILRPSGNVIVDESVSAVAKRVTQVEPLPPGLGAGFYEVNINFELNSDQ